jgi:WD40 repeat protein
MRAWALVLIALSIVPFGCRRAAPEQIRVVPQVSVVQPRRLQFSPVDPNRLLVMEATGLVGVWDVAQPKLPALFASIRASATDARFTPDGNGIVTVGIDGYVRCWNVDGTPRWTSATRHEGWARTVAVSPTRIVTGGEDEKIRFWTSEGAVDGEPLQAHQGAVLSVDIAANGDLVSLGSDEVLRLWKPSPASGGPAYVGQELYREATPRHTRMLPSLLRLDVQWGWDRAAVFSPRGDTIAAALFDGRIRFFNADGTPRSVTEKAHQGHHVRVLDFSPDGLLLVSIGFNGGVQLWNRDGTPHGKPLDAHRGPGSASLSPATARASPVRCRRHAAFWNMAGASLGELPRPYSDRVRSFSLGPRTRESSLGGDGGAVSIWNLDGSPAGNHFRLTAVRRMRWRFRRWKISSRAGQHDRTPVRA